MIRRLLTPSGVYGALRDQLGSIRGVYLRSNEIAKVEDFSRPELVVLVHGFFQTRNIWEVMEDRLRFDGFGVISLNLGGLMRRFNTHAVDDSARYLADKLETLIARYDLQGVHLIGHSKGGLISRRYVQHYAGHKHVKSLITLGTPHHGTPTALVALPLFGGWSSITDLLPGSRVLRRLAEDTFPAHVPLTSIYSREDLVCPHWCSVLHPRAGESSLSNVQVRGIGHSQLCWDPGVYRVIRLRLAHASQLWTERAA